MGNIQQYCGNHCMNKDQIFPFGERILNQSSNRVLNDYQEMCLKKTINAWKRFKNEKNNPYSYKNLRNSLSKLDEFINTNYGKFITIDEFELGMHQQILHIYQKLASYEKTSGFKSVSLPNDAKTDFSLESFENQLFLRRPVILEESGNIYFGFWNLKGEREGYGKLVTSKGILIEGYWYPQGNCYYGRYFYKNGTYFEGILMNNTPNGRGVLKTFENSLYSGEWLNGEYHGQGLLFVNNSCKFEGEFKNSMFFGRGKILYQDKETESYFYDGYFEYNKFDGEGNFKLLKNDDLIMEEYTGNWNKGLPNGRGIYSWKSGDKYEGTYENGKKKGQGKYLFNVGRSFFDGVWSNGKPNGRGNVLLSENLKISGMWKLGKFQKFDNNEDIKKINNDENKLNFPFENEIFSNDFQLNITFVTPKTENVNQILTDENNAKLQFEKTLSKAFYMGLYKGLAKGGFQNLIKK